MFDCMITVKHQELVHIMITGNDFEYQKIKTEKKKYEKPKIMDDNNFQ